MNGVGPTVFVVDDDSAVCDSLAFLIQSVGLRVETFSSPLAFLADVEPTRSGCVVLDVRMPEMDGLDVLAELRSRGATIPVLFVTAHNTVPVAVQAMQDGAVDFVEKPINQETLLDRIQEAVQNDAGERAENASHKGVVTRHGSLTQREREVFQLVVEGLPNKVIADQLCLSQKTVESHRARVMRKMKAGSLADLVRMAIQAGISLETT